MRFLGVRKLTKSYVVEQVVGQPDLPAIALELAKITKAEKLVHRHLSKAGLEKVDPDYRYRGLAVGFQIDTTKLRNRGVIDRALSGIP